MPTVLPDHTLVAVNTATASENRIHDDDVAAAFGFRGGLVPGVDVYAYLCHAPLEHWGERFLHRGEAALRLDAPIYHGQATTIRARLDDDGRLQADAVSGGAVCATLTARLVDSHPEPFATADAPLPAAEDRRPAAPDLLPPGRDLGTFTDRLAPEAADAFLADIGAPEGALSGSGIVHPGWLLRHANGALSRTVLLGPWIHVGSTVRLRAPLAVGAEFRVRGRVKDRYEHKGHRFVVLHVVIVGPDDQVVTDVEHTAIYEPRQVRSPTNSP
ncbi:MAG: hotdog fold domain-containing protein [Actinomycetota bacterium]